MVSGEWLKRVKAYVINSVAIEYRKESSPGVGSVCWEDKGGQTDVPHLSDYLVGSCVCGRIPQPGWNGVIEACKMG